MSIRAIPILAAATLTLTVSGCISEKTVLTNDQGQTVTCENKGHIGIVSPIRLHMKQDRCIKTAENAGYRVATGAGAASSASSSSAPSG